MAGKMNCYKLVVLGDGGVGKTALTIQLCLNHFVETYDPTIEDSYRKQVVIDSQSCMLEVLDTAGQEEYTALRDQWIRDGEGFILVYSITSRDSFNRIRRFYSQIERVKGNAILSAARSDGIGYMGPSIGSSHFASSDAPAPIMLVGNKADRITEREVSVQEGGALAKEMGCQYLEASAKNCINVEKAFYDVVRTLRAQRQDKTPQPRAAFSFGKTSAVDDGKGTEHYANNDPYSTTRNAQFHDKSQSHRRRDNIMNLKRKGQPCTIL